MKKKITILYPFHGETFGGSHVSVINMIKKINTIKFHPLVFLHKKGKLCKIFSQIRPPSIPKTIPIENLPAMP